LLPPSLLQNRACQFPGTRLLSAMPLVMGILAFVVTNLMRYGPKTRDVLAGLPPRARQLSGPRSAVSPAVHLLPGLCGCTRSIAWACHTRNAALGPVHDAGRLRSYAI